MCVMQSPSDVLHYYLFLYTAFDDGVLLCIQEVKIFNTDRKTILPFSRGLLSEVLPYIIPLSVSSSTTIQSLLICELLS